MKLSDEALRTVRALPEYGSWYCIEDGTLLVSEMNVGGAPQIDEEDGTLDFGEVCVAEWDFIAAINKLYGTHYKHKDLNFRP